MTADYYRYLVEFAPEQSNKDNAAKHYEAAMEIAQAELLPTHPIRLGMCYHSFICCGSYLHIFQLTRFFFCLRFDIK
jgi:hypothetical protein